MAKKSDLASTAIDQPAADQAEIGAAAADQANTEAVIADQETGEITAEASNGTRARRAWSMKNFITDPDWINVNIVSKGRGYHTLVGRIVGMANSAQRRENVIKKPGRPDETVVSVALVGLFTAQTVEGAEHSFSMLFLPMAFAEQVEAALALDGVKGVPIDVDIGLEATGKTIPYEWTVTSYLEGRAQRALRKLVSARQIGKPAATVSTVALIGTTPPAA